MANAEPAPTASFDPSSSALVIQQMRVTDPEVITEARRWTAGRRGAVVPVDELTGADLAPFVTQALAVGARAIASAGSTQDTFELERLVAEVGATTVASTAEAAEATTKATSTAVQEMSGAVAAARQAITETEAASRRSYAETVTASTTALRAEIERLIGGESPELLAKLGPVITSAGRSIAEQGAEHTEKLLEKVSRQFNPDDPTSPFARQAKALAEQQHLLAESLGRNHLSLVGKVDELANAVAVQKAAQDAIARTANVTPLKGATYELAVGVALNHIAAGLGDEYVEVGTTVGTIPNCKKGDGVLTVDGGTARVVVEMNDSVTRRAWGPYLDEAERNREAAASIGLVPNSERNGDQIVRVLGARRVVLAFDPESDTTDLLRCVVQLMRTSAIAATSRGQGDGLATAEEHIRSAVELLEHLNAIRKTSGVIRKGADTIEKECNSAQTGMQRHLGQAIDALTGVSLGAPTDTVSDDGFGSDVA